MPTAAAARRGALAGPATAGEPGWAPLLVVLAGTFVTFLDFFIVNVALPSIGRDLHAGPSAVSLVVAGYAGPFAVGMITGGRLGDRFGRRRLFAIGLALFTAASAACGLAPTVAALIAARLVQGAAGALLTPQVLALLGTIYTGRRRASAFSAYGVAMGAAGVLGQLIGGALIQADVAGAGWRTIFLINVPIGLVTLAFVRRVLPAGRGEQTRLDPGGTVLISLALAALVLPLIEGRAHGWPLWSGLSLGAAPALGALFVAYQARRRHRGRAVLVPVQLFRGRTFTVGSLVAFGFGLVPAGFFFVLAIYLQSGRGYSALASGAVFAALGVGYFLALPLAARFAERLGHQVLTLGALLVAVGGLLLRITDAAASVAALVPGLALTGFGIGLVLVPLSATVLAGVEPAQAGAAAGVLATAQQVGGTVGVALIGVVFFAGGPVVGAFGTSLWLTVGLALATAVLAQLLRPRRPAPAQDCR